MSYILDALRKADQERSIGEVPDLDTPHWVQRRGGSVRPWVWVVIGLLVVNGALLALLYNRDGSGSAVSGNVADLEQSAPMDTPIKPLARPERKVITKPRQALPPVVEAPQARNPPAVEAPRTAISDGGSVVPAVVRPRAALSAVTVPAQSSGSEIQEWSELSVEFRGGYNKPRLDVHVYDEEPSRRFILIDLKRYVEGDTLKDGAKLEKIMPGSIQLYHQGARFRVDR